MLCAKLLLLFLPWPLVAPSCGSCYSLSQPEVIPVNKGTFCHLCYFKMGARWFLSSVIKGNQMWWAATLQQSTAGSKHLLLALLLATLVCIQHTLSSGSKSSLSPRTLCWDRPPTAGTAESGKANACDRTEILNWNILINYDFAGRLPMGKNFTDARAVSDSIPSFYASKDRPNDLVAYEASNYSQSPWLFLHWGPELNSPWKGNRAWILTQNQPRMFAVCEKGLRPCVLIFRSPSKILSSKLSSKQAHPDLNLFCLWQNTCPINFIIYSSHLFSLVILDTGWELFFR